MPLGELYLRGCTLGTIAAASLQGLSPQAALSTVVQAMEAAGGSAAEGSSQAAPAAHQASSADCGDPGGGDFVGVELQYQRKDCTRDGPYAG
jgi:hypothetical protein